MGDVILYRVSARACNFITGQAAGTTSKNRKRIQTEDDAEADERLVKEGQAMATSHTPAKKIKNSHGQEEDRSGTRWYQPPFTAAQGARLQSSGRPEETEPSGFVYSAPLCGLLTYPPELITALRDFATDHDFDLLPINEMILATHLWMDIQASPNLAMETSAETGQAPSPVPNISLACMLLHYGHWLKWTHLMQLDEHPNPFRWMRKAYQEDFVEEEELSTTEINSLDEEKIKALMTEVGTTIPGLDMSYRVRVPPCCMPGASNGHVHRAVGTEAPSRIALALTGIPDVRLMGLQSYERPTQWIADHKLKTISWPRSLDNLLTTSRRYVCTEEQSPKSEEPATMNPIWSTVTGVKGCWGFAPLTLPVPSVIPGPLIVSRKKDTPPALYREFILDTRAHYYRLACFMRGQGPREYTMEELGLPPLTAAGPSMSMPRNFLIPNISMEGTWEEWEAQEKASRRVEAWKSPAGNMGMEAYDELLALWTAIPQGCHPMWYTGLEKLKSAKRENVTMEGLLLFVDQIKEREQRDHDFIAGVMSKVQEGFLPTCHDWKLDGASRAVLESEIRTVWPWWERVQSRIDEVRARVGGWLEEWTKLADQYAQMQWL
ncbi:hypothetical protein HDV57DRAFT_508681 [Trichoderma longibrachiatum]|uniref:Uncharacterized protein n=1 Tax=Trichoderma longibrachiatum ATCC 18648 TaxID=983965 RepID=A0A2T4BPG6_TRILO|nr:hypothetical protein M440DRAFT_1344793 [Trichoderma longibrachiatum ATCC 18648]